MSIHDKKVVITGMFQDLTRAEIKKRLEGLGAKVLSSISRNTDILFAGDKAGSKKEKALSLGVEIRSQRELLTLLEGGQTENHQEVACYGAG